MDQIVENYRQYLRLHSAARKTGDHSAFATNQTKKTNQTGSSTFRGNQLPTPKCICGKIHWYPDCFYLNPKKQRPNGWTEHSETRQKIDEALKNPAIKDKVQTSLAKRLAAEQRQAEQSSQANKPDTSTTSTTSTNSGTSSTSGTSGKVFSAKFHSHTSGKVFSTSLKFHNPKSLSLREVFILDTGADLHVCNSSMLHCYTKQVDAHPDDRIEAGTELIPVKSYGLVKISFDTPHGSEIITLTNVAYVPDFLTNVAALDLFAAKGVHFDSSVPHMHSEGKTVFHAYRLGGHYTLMNAQNRIAAISKQGTHQAHALTKKSRMPMSGTPSWLTLLITQSCNLRIPQATLSSAIFPLLKFRRQTSARLVLSQNHIISIHAAPKKSEVSDKPFHQVVGITYEPSAPDTPAQNGHAERKGGVLDMKAQALRIEADIPGHLRNEAIRTAGYITNRTPMRKHDWKTPFEKVTSTPHSLSHLRSYRCKAYAHNHHLSKKLKLDKRAHIGHLVGYDSTNIFRIWIPSKRKIIRTRDVLFDERKHYDPSEPDLTQLITEPMIETTFEIPEHFRTIVSSLELEDDEISVTDLDASEDVFFSTTEQELPTEKGVGNSNEGPTLPTPQPTPESTINPIPESNPDPPPPTPPVTRSPVTRSQGRFQETSMPKHDVSSSLDVGNILPKGVTRSRKRKYAAALQASLDGKLTAFHNAFSVFSTAIK